MGRLHLERACTRSARIQARPGRALAGALLLAVLQGCAPQTSPPQREGAGAGQSRQRCSVEEMEALERLYAATGGAAWTCGAPGRPCPRARLGAGGAGGAGGADGRDAPAAATWAVGLGTGWLDPSGVIKASVPDCCLWYGVYCDGGGDGGGGGAGEAAEAAGEGEGEGEDPGGVITAIYLPGNALVGSLPPDFGLALPRLEHVDLSQNNLTGTIPATIAGPPRAAGSRLRDLVLHDNFLEGALPDSLRAARGLRRLVLAGNALHGHIPPWLGELAGLEMIILNDNQLEGTIPPALGNLTKLSHLYLQNNKMHGRVPAEIIADPDTAPGYLFVNGNAQPTRLSFDEVDEDKKAVHTRVRSHRLVDEMVEQDVQEEDALDADEAQRRYRKRKVREHKDRMVEKVKQAYSGTARASPVGLEDFARGRRALAGDVVGVGMGGRDEL